MDTFCWDYHWLAGLINGRHGEMRMSNSKLHLDADKLIELQDQFRRHFITRFPALSQQR